MYMAADCVFIKGLRKATLSKLKLAVEHAPGHCRVLQFVDLIVTARESTNVGAIYERPSSPVCPKMVSEIPCLLTNASSTLQHRSHSSLLSGLNVYFILYKLAISKLGLRYCRTTKVL